MVYKSGTVVNSYELTQIIHSCMRDAGWRLVSGNSSDGIDSVFYSDGVDGNNDIYIRVAANQSDIICRGDIQFPYSDGYNGFVNFFAYQYYPDGAGPESGCNELGRYGPLMYCMGGNSSDLYVYNLSITDDGYAMRGVRLFDVSGYPNRGYLDGVSDGHRYIIYNAYYGLDYIDLSHDYLSLSQPDGNFAISTLRAASWFRKGPRDPLLWALHYLYGFKTRNQLTGAITTGYAIPPWGTNAAQHGWAVNGVCRNRKKYIYVARGYDTTSWARYDIDTNTWTSLSPSIPAGVYHGSSAVYIRKEITGYEYDRIYMVRGNDSAGFYSISVADDGSVNPDGAGWVAHTNTPFTIGWYNVASGNLIHMGGERLFLARAGTSSLYRWEFPNSPTDIGGSWAAFGTLKTSMYGSTYSGYYPFFHVRNHLSSRVEVDENELAPYWVFVNKDRIVVVTKNYRSSYNSGYDIAYAGLFETAYDKRITTVSENVSNGSTTIKVSDPSIFKVGEYYQILKNGPGRMVRFFSGELRHMGNAERIQVTSVNQSTSSINIDHALQDEYPSGSKIGRDVQPVGLLVMETSEFQAMTNISLNEYRISSDPAFQTYRLGQTMGEITTFSERVGGTHIYPVTIKTQGVSGMVDSEVRGTLIGVYRCGGTLENEGLVDIDGKTYISFYIPTLLSRLLIGPME